VAVLAATLHLGQAAYPAAPAARGGARPGLAATVRPRPARPSRPGLVAGGAGARRRAAPAAPSRRRPALVAKARSRSRPRLAAPRRRHATAPRLSAQAPARLRAHPERIALLPAFVRASASSGVPAALLEAVAWQESGWQVKVTSQIGAVGVGQLVPVTVAFTNGLLQRSLDPVRPEDNILLSAHYLAYLLRRTGGNEAVAVAAYAQGPASLQREGMHPGTRQYVADVLALRDRFAT